MFLPGEKATELQMIWELLKESELYKKKNIFFLNQSSNASILKHDHNRSNQLMCEGYCPGHVSMLNSARR